MSTSPHTRSCLRLLLVVLALQLATPAVHAAGDYPYPGTQVIRTPHTFTELHKRLEQAVEASGFIVVTRASASAGAASRGVSIPGNLVIGVFRNDYAVRMLQHSVAAGIEAPLRFYVTENADGTATLVYRLPSAVFQPYANPELDAMARELDPVWKGIAAAATAR